MRKTIEWQKKLVPDMLEVMGQRYRILQYVRVMQPVGRRTLAQSLELSERVLRNEVTFMKKQDLVHVHAAGMTLSEEGERVLEALEEVVKSASGLASLENEVSRVLRVRLVIVVAGNSDNEEWVKRELGRACIQEMVERLFPGDVVALAGGTTLASVAEMMQLEERLRDVTFVPARGGLGENVDLQSNTVSSEMARRARANYRLLHVPDQLSTEARDSLQHEPGIKELLDLIRHPRMVIHGVGEAETMAGRRGTKAETMNYLKKEEAVAEAFGYYFNREGSIVHKEETIGLQLDDLTNQQMVVTVAGGSSKAEAIAAYMSYRPSDILITDEGAARAVIEQGRSGGIK